MSITPPKAVSSLKAIEILNRLKLFRFLTPNEKQRVVELPNLFKTFKAEELLLKIGEFDDSLYILLTGNAEVNYSNLFQITILPGQFVGEAGFINNTNNRNTVVAISDIIAVKFSRSTFQQLPIRVREIIKDHIVDGLASQIEQRDKQIQKMVKENIELLETVEDLEQYVPKNRRKK